MKLCIVTPAIIKGDGQGRANYEIVQEALRRGHQVTLVAHRVADEIAEHPSVEWIRFQSFNLPTALLKEIDFAIRTAFWLKRYGPTFDLIQTYGAITFGYGHVNTAQFVHTSWLQSPVHISKQYRSLYGAYHWLHSVLNSNWERRAFQRSQTVIAVSDGIRQELKSLGIPDHQIRVILNGVDIQEFIPDRISREELNLPAQEILALFAGDIKSNRKNLDTVLRSLIQIPQLHLVVVGKQEGSPYPALARELGISDRVYFVGFRRDLARIMRTVDFFVFPSRYEPFGMVVAEAMASGLPVITSASTGAAEIVTPESGLIIQDPEDIVSLTQAMQALTLDQELRTSMGRSGREIAQQHSWTSKASAYLNLFETMEIIR
jgi:glycosyltransferase involved in cell wall biosynthesis